MDNIWAEIREDYKKAKYALWFQKRRDGWHRDEATGYYHMCKAYHEAKNSVTKDHLLYGRILMMMSDERRYKITEYERFREYIRPAMDEYRLAVENGQHPTEKEMERIQWEYDFLSWQETCTNAPYEEQVKLIQGYENLGEFSFFDSQVILFQHSEHQAKLKLRYDSLIAAFVFDDVCDIHIDADPAVTWITEFCCYPCFHDKTMITFDTESYCIKCRKISLESIEKDDSGGKTVCGK